MTIDFGSITQTVPSDYEVSCGHNPFIWAALIGVLATLVGRIGMTTPAAMQAVAPDAEPVEPVESLLAEPVLAEPVLTKPVA